jgi:transposase
VKGVDISLAGGWIEVASIVHPPGEVVVNMRPVSVLAKGPGSETEQLRGDLHGRWRQATRAVMVLLLSLHGLAAAQIAELLDCHPATVRRWIGRFNDQGAGRAGRPARSGRPRLGGRRLTDRIAALLGRPGLWTLPRIRRYLGWPQVSMRTLYRRVRLVAIWRRPKLTARGDPDHDHVVAGIMARLIELPRQSVVLAEDETHLNLLPHVRASWTLRGARPEVLTPGTNRKITVLSAIELTTGRWVYRLGRRCAADFIALLQMLAETFPRAPVIVVICDNDSIHHARKVTAYLKQHPRLKLLYGARCSPHDNRRADLGGAEELRGEHRREMARPAPADPLLLPQPLTRTDAGHRRALDQPLAAPSYERNFWNAALAAARTVRRQAARPAVPACGQEAARPSSSGSRRHQPPLPLPPGVRTQQPPQSRPHADQRVTVHEPLKILSLCLRKEQRTGPGADLLAPRRTHGAPTRPHAAAAQPRRQQAPSGLPQTTAGGTHTRPSAAAEHQPPCGQLSPFCMPRAAGTPCAPLTTTLQRGKVQGKRRKRVVSPAQRLYLRVRAGPEVPPRP